ncbi:MAG: 2-dehydropantoate 2-reductase [Rhodospirillaceae bacterium]|nr:2-dehydropantoate 2-reductase [Rhodospirillaceae bacterium]HAA92902.1 2-dehydropantoate 2-reductase [Rhodospirillaceae bacterium]
MGWRIAMVGAGAVGGMCAGHMARNGEDVTFIDPWPEHVENMRNNGLELRGMTEAETHNVPVKALHITEVQNTQKEGPFDVAFISSKSYDTVWLTALIAPYLSEHGFVVSLQNALNEERVASVVGPEKAVGCIASGIGVELEQPGYIQRNVPIRGNEYPVFRVGELHGRVTKRSEKVADLMRYTDGSKVTNNLWGERWSKLCINTSHNGLSASTGLNGNGMAINDYARDAQIKICGETARVAQALGFVLENRKNTEPHQWIAAAEGDKKALQEIEDFLIEETEHRGDGQRPSMGQDMQKGRKTEIGEMNGYVAEKASEIGMPAPYNLKMVDLVRRCERGELKPDPENVKDY